MNDPHIKGIGERIRQIREENGMMWQDIEEASGLCDSVLRYMAKGRRDAGVTKYIALAPALGVSLDYLLTGKESGELETAELAETIQDVSQELMDASDTGDTELVRGLLAAGADVHEYDDYALRWASLHGHAEVVKLLLDAGANIHAWDDAALLWAVERGHAEVVRLLLKSGADVHAWDDYAIPSAVEHGHDEVAKILTDWKEANK